MYSLKTGFTNLETLMQSIGQELIASGFVVNCINRNAQISNISALSTSIVLDAGSGIDIRSDNEPWSVILKADDAGDWFSLNVLPKSQIQNLDEAATTIVTGTADPLTGLVTSTGFECGRISRGADPDKYFVSRMGGWKLGAVGSGHPISYCFSASDHGFSLCCWSETSTDSGTDFSWVVVQRGVQSSNLGLPTYKSPLLAVFSTEGAGDPNTLDEQCIETYTVIEDDINAVTPPVSACVVGPDQYPIINPMQQVSTTADNAVMVLFPQLYNTSRHVYFLVLDMLGYSSADTISMSSTVPVSFQSGVRNYQALLANGVGNTGVRILFPM